MRLSTPPPRWLVAVIGCAIVATSQAQVTAPVVTVKGQAPRDPPTEKTKSVTVLERSHMDRWQPDTVFDAVQGTPGVSVNGGPRASGMSFNIRGYDDTDDVLITLDGAQKNFEKYRFGGTFIEPELLKTISVTRGPDLLTGAGALGGSVAATTRDAADFLRPGERVGARIKYGTASVNDEIARTGIGFARPRDDVDLLVAATRRTAGDYRIADGSTLPDSNLNQRSLLAKGTWFPADDLSLGWSTSTVSNRSREAYDATGGVPGVFGVVQRMTDDTTHTASVRRGGSGWIDLIGTVGRSRIEVFDLHRPGQSQFANAITGNLRDTFDYDVTTLDLRNTSRWRTGAVSHQTTALLQAIRNARQIRRVTDNPAVNSALYPGGQNPAQPSGTRDSIGIALVHTASLGAFSVSPGLRWDRVGVTADGQTRDTMIRFGQPWEITYAEPTLSLAGTWQTPGVPLIAGYRYVQAFKPPLIDEVFTQGAFSRCTRPNLGALAPPSGICGALYRPERAVTHEWSATLPTTRLASGASLDGRLAYFRNERHHLMLSLMPVSPTEVGQPGWEYRQGVELETNLTGRMLFAGAAYTRIRGQVFDGMRLLDLFDAPGDTLALTLGARIADGMFDLGLRYRDVSARSVVVGLTTGNRPIVGRQKGYELIDLFFGWRPSRDVEFRLALDNLTNEAYELNNGFGGSIGAPAPGRNLRFAMSMQF